MECEVHELANSMRSKIEALPPLRSECCIYRVPRTLREFNSSAYAPCLISIGPLHHGDPSLRPMQEQKLRYMQDFVGRNAKRSLKDYLGATRRWEGRARECYMETIDLSRGELVELLLFDGSFVIEFFLKWYLDEADEIDRIFSRPSLEHVIKRDLLLLENQLPFFVLEGLYDIAFGDDVDEEQSLLLPPFVDLVRAVLAEGKDLSEEFKIDGGREILHLVDLLRACLLPPSPRDLDDEDGGGGDRRFEFPPGVERLHDAGVRFEAAPRGAPLLDISFDVDGGLLRVPRLEIEDDTESLLLNLSAFEQCHRHFDSYYIVDYLVLMDVLITSLKDVDILMGSGIVLNYLGSNDDVADVFNTICKGATYRQRRFYYSGLCRELSAYSKAPWTRWRATLSHDYFSNPWTIISVVVAIVLLFLTVIQTACTIISMR